MNSVWIFDIDGVIADNRHRLVLAENRQWDDFYSPEKVISDGVFLPAVHWIRSLKELGDDIFFATGRSDVSKESTLRWFEANGLGDLLGNSMTGKYESLLMRKEGDHSKSCKVKIPMIKHIMDLYCNDDYSTLFYFIDDSPLNILEAKKAIPEISTMLFGISRFDQFEKGDTL